MPHGNLHGRAPSCDSPLEGRRLVGARTRTLETLRARTGGAVHGTLGPRFCSDEDCSWLDLSGNASIRAPGLLVRIEGNANRFKRRGRKASAFALLASRVTRQLLMHPTIDFSQRQLARRIGMDEGYVSRVVRNLADQGLVAKYGNLVQVTDSDLLLRAWLDEFG